MRSSNSTGTTRTNADAPYSPNADEAMSLLSMSGTPTVPLIEEACHRFLEFGVGPEGTGAVVVRSGALGAYVATRKDGGTWIPAFWDQGNAPQHVVDVTGVYALPPLPYAGVHVHPRCRQQFPRWSWCWSHAVKWRHCGRWVDLLQSLSYQVILTVDGSDSVRYYLGLLHHRASRATPTHQDKD